ncbi:hypothetical protein Acr_04g0000610 [Actinidia rufa]|uniref:Uncharacterized protein n=1 Tax=Actinidia rufa TaxID=165716 RepID=A0A7J0EFT9_9ERIC|nr:hypothetical protein Acr_04g0000610 [Actinidia rufa]
MFMARPPRPSPNRRNAWNERGRMSCMGCDPPPVGSITMFQTLHDYFWAAVEDRALTEKEIPSSLLIEFENDRSSLIALISILRLHMERSEFPLSVISFESGSAPTTHMDRWTKYIIREVDWNLYEFKGEEKDTLVGLQRGYAVCTCGMWWQEDGILENFSRVAHKNTYVRWIRYFFRDYSTKKLDGGSGDAKPKYFTEVNRAYARLGETLTNYGRDLDFWRKRFQESIRQPPVSSGMGIT